MLDHLEGRPGWFKKRIRMVTRRLSRWKNRHQPHSSATLLEACSRSDENRATKLLVMKPLVDVNMKDDYGYSALHLASYNGLTKVAIALIEAG